MLPPHYLESRLQFRELAARRSASLASFALDPSDSSALALTTDTAYFGAADAPLLIVISSGTHGVEGYIGASCQFRFMERKADLALPRHVGVLLVHAVNPWGYMHNRRVTAEGIDLNRNFIDFSSTLPASEYHRFHSLLVDDYRLMPFGLFNRLRLLCCVVGPRRRRRLQAALTAGQYDTPSGLFFGGQAPARSRLVWEQILRTHARHRNYALLLDIHSGLGKRGHGELISDLPSASPRFSRLVSWFADEVRSMTDGASVSTPLRGTLTSAFADAIGIPADAIGLEFGTRPPLAVLDALRADQWAANQPAYHPGRQHAADLMKTAFAPADASWHAMAISRFDQVVDQMIAGTRTCA